MHKAKLITPQTAIKKTKQTKKKVGKKALHLKPDVFQEREAMVPHHVTCLTARINIFRENFLLFHA